MQKFVVGLVLAFSLILTPALWAAEASEPATVSGPEFFQMIVESLFGELGGNPSSPGEIGPAIEPSGLGTGAEIGGHMDPNGLGATGGASAGEDPPEIGPHMDPHG